MIQGDNVVYYAVITVLCLLRTLSVFGVGQLGRTAKGEARRAEPKFWVWFFCGKTGKNWRD